MLKYHRLYALCFEIIQTAKQTNVISLNSTIIHKQEKGKTRKQLIAKKTTTLQIVATVSRFCFLLSVTLNMVTITSITDNPISNLSR